MKIIEQLNNGISRKTLDAITEFFERNEGETVIIELTKPRDARTARQNAAMHLWFRQLADEMNNVGVPLSVQVGNRQPVERMWNAMAVKDHMFRPIMQAIFKKKSTTKLERKELDQVIMPLNKYLSETWLISIPFPSEEELAMQNLIINN